MVKVVLRDFIFRRRDEAAEQPTPPAPPAAQAVPEPDV